MTGKWVEACVDFVESTTNGKALITSLEKTKTEEDKKKQQNNTTNNTVVEDTDTNSSNNTSNAITNNVAVQSNTEM